MWRSGRAEMADDRTGGAALRPDLPARPAEIELASRTARESWVVRSSVAAESFRIHHIHTKCKPTVDIEDYNCNPPRVWVAISLERASKRRALRGDEVIGSIFVQL